MDRFPGDVPLDANEVCENRTAGTTRGQTGRTVSITPGKGDHAQADLTVRIASAARLRLRGNLDLSTRDLLAAVLQELTAPTVYVDVRELRIADTAGLHTLGVDDELRRRRHGRVILLGTSSQLREALATANLEHLLPWRHRPQRNRTPDQPGRVPGQRPVTVLVQDNGSGRPADIPAGGGLHNMTDCAGKLGGTCAFSATVEGGTLASWISPGAPASQTPSTAPAGADKTEDQQQLPQRHPEDLGEDYQQIVHELLAVGLSLCTMLQPAADPSDALVLTQTIDRLDRAIRRLQTVAFNDAARRDREPATPGIAHVGQPTTPTA